MSNKTIAKNWLLIETTIVMRPFLICFIPVLMSILMLQSQLQILKLQSQLQPCYSHSYSCSLQLQPCYSHSDSCLCSYSYCSSYCFRCLHKSFPWTLNTILWALSTFWWLNSTVQLYVCCSYSYSCHSYSCSYRPITLNTLGFLSRSSFRCDFSLCFSWLSRS